MYSYNSFFCISFTFYAYDSDTSHSISSYSKYIYQCLRAIFCRGRCIICDNSGNFLIMLYRGKEFYISGDNSRRFLGVFWIGIVRKENWENWENWVNWVNWVWYWNNILGFSEKINKLSLVFIVFTVFIGISIINLNSHKVFWVSDTNSLFIVYISDLTEVSWTYSE